MLQGSLLITKCWNITQYFYCMWLEPCPCLKRYLGECLCQLFPSQALTGELTLELLVYTRWGGVFVCFQQSGGRALNITMWHYMIINSGQKDVEVFCVALVTYKLTIIYKINDPSANFVNLKKKIDNTTLGLSPSSGMVVRKNILKIAEIRWSDVIREWEKTSCMHKK